MGISKWRSALARVVGLTLVVLLAGGFSSGCRGSGNGDDGGGEETEQSASEDSDEEKSGEGEGDEDENGDEAVPVALASLGRGRIESVLRFSTNLEAESQVQVLAESSREVRQLMVEEGDLVRRGRC